MSASDVAHSAIKRHQTYHLGLSEGDYFVMRHLREFIDSNLRRFVNPGDQVADVGCGEQPWRASIERLGGTYTGIDVAQNSKGTVHVIASILDLTDWINRYDVVLCTEVLEHVPDSQRAMLGLAHISKPRSPLIITTPFMYPLHEEPHDYVRLTPYQLVRLAETTALEVLTLERAGNEIEVMATVWSSIWTRAWPGRAPGLARKVLRRLLVGGANLGAAVASRLIGPRLPQNHFLSLLCVLGKQETGR
jgi:hypothetical protein